MDKVNNVQMSAQELREQIFISGGNKDAGTIDEAFKHTVKQLKLTKQPQNVFSLLEKVLANGRFCRSLKILALYPGCRS